MQTYRKSRALVNYLKELGPVVVCYSGGADSTFLLAQAVTSGLPAQAVIINSESLTQQELEQAQKQAGALGVCPTVLEVEELAHPKLAANPPDRCYYCKQLAYGAICDYAKRHGLGQVVDGTNHDDLSDIRPGLKARQEYGVKSPLAEVGLTKTEIRELSKALGLATWDKPASPCLNSRVPYGQPITRGKLEQIAQAEACLRGFGLQELRVRHHGEIARIEVPEQDFRLLLQHREEINQRFRALGFLWVTLDLAGFVSGSLNRGAL